MGRQISERFKQPGYGKGVASVRRKGTLYGEDLIECMRATFRDPAYEPPLLPGIALELHQLSQRPNVDIRQIVELIEHDSMLAGRVLKLAQSPVYAARTPIRSIQKAVMWLGLLTLRDVVMQVALNMRVFRAEGFTDLMTKLQRHSIATAHIARVVCHYTSIEAEFSFLCGLLHDVGMAGILIALAEGDRGQEKPQIEELFHALRDVHEEASRIMAKVWKLPEEVQLVVGQHHNFMVAGVPHPIIATVCVADHYANKLGIGLQDDKLGLVDLSPPDILEKALAALGISEKQQRLLEGEAEAVVERALS